MQFLVFALLNRPPSSGIRLLTTRVLPIKMVANKETELTQNLHLGHENWLIIHR